MIPQRLLGLGLKQLRKVAGKDSGLELALKERYRRRKKSRSRKRVGPTFIQHGGENFVLIQSRGDPEPRVGILVRGGCDLPSAFAAAPFIAPQVRGTVAIFKQGTGGELGAHRSDQILQTLNTIPGPATEEVRRRLRLEEHYFSPRLFEEKEFTIDGFPQFGAFPSSVVVLSIGSDLVRVVYRHRRDGYLIDPGGFWLGQLTDRVLPDPSIARWFKESFQSIGRIGVEDFQANLEQVIRLIRDRIGAHVIMYNTLVVDPGNETHNYQLLERVHVVRRRQFNLALGELSARLDFHVVDIDRILKEQGVQAQVDFAHVPFSQMAPIGQEFHRILKELEVV
ncbi:MAG: SGNH/GDSL hydrolase family protein [Acidimicrobiia bacterium]